MLKSFQPDLVTKRQNCILEVHFWLNHKLFSTCLILQHVCMKCAPKRLVLGRKAVRKDQFLPSRNNEIKPKKIMIEGKKINFQMFNNKMYKEKMKATLQKL